MKIIIGDVHGNVKYYKYLIESLFPIMWKSNEIETIQLGDFGFKYSFDTFEKDIFDKNEPKKNMISFGNHDYYPYLNKPYSCGNWSFEENDGYNLMTIRGAKSIDKGVRTEGVDWFDNEEMSYKELDELLDIWADLRPDVVVSHDIPQFVQQKIFHFADQSITRNYLQMMFEIHQPKLWLFGHYHQDKELTVNGTLFKCIEPNGFICVEDKLQKLNML